MADRLQISRHTVETHLTHAYQKLDVRSRTELPHTRRRRARSSAPAGRHRDRLPERRHSCRLGIGRQKCRPTDGTGKSVSDRGEPLCIVRRAAENDSRVAGAPRSG
ncbi:hypothetical protein GC207_00795 [bacterium]|nr:hypothetical protein [bacterium]